MGLFCDVTSSSLKQDHGLKLIAIPVWHLRVHQSDGVLRILLAVSHRYCPCWRIETTNGSALEGICSGDSRLCTVELQRYHMLILILQPCDNANNRNKFPSTRRPPTVDILGLPFDFIEDSIAGAFHTWLTES